MKAFLFLFLLLHGSSRIKECLAFLTKGTSALSLRHVPVPQHCYWQVDPNLVAHNNDNNKNHNKIRLTYLAAINERTVPRQQEESTTSTLLHSKNLVPQQESSSRRECLSLIRMVIAGSAAISTDVALTLTQQQQGMLAHAAAEGSTNNNKLLVLCDPSVSSWKKK
jgi:hypothetical protein